MGKTIKKNTHGGIGRNQGRKKGIETDTIAFRLPSGKKKAFYAKYRKGERAKLLADFVAGLIET